jgi:putative PIN family toxin of toxin-antitoxin system
MILRQKIVLDTNTLVSRLLLPDSLPARAARKAIRQGDILSSQDTLFELADVLSRPKFDKYVSLEDRREFLRYFTRIAEKVQIVKTVSACRDVKDNKFLELAVNGEASVIITGDRDLLDLHPFLTVQIISPANYLEIS